MVMQSQGGLELVAEMPQSRKNTTVWGAWIVGFVTRKKARNCAPLSLTFSAFADYSSMSSLEEASDGPKFARTAACLDCGR
jgi:hypothetical protein